MKKSVFVMSIMALVALLAVSAAKPECNPSNACDHINDIYGLLGGSSCSSSCTSQISNLQSQITSINNYISSNEASWQQSSECNECQCSESSAIINNFTPASGMSRRSLGKMIMNDSTYFYDHDSFYPELVALQQENSALRREIGYLYDRINKAELRIVAIERRN
jgi:hypothetical protein